MIPIPEIFYRGDLIITNVTAPWDYKHGRRPALFGPYEVELTMVTRTARPAMGLDEGNVVRAEIEDREGTLECRLVSKLETSKAPEVGDVYRLPKICANPKALGVDNA